MIKIVTVLICAASLCRPQVADDSKPASSNVAGSQYPRIHSDLRITFRVTAPDAQKVQIKPGGDGLGKSPYEMARDDKGGLPRIPLKVAALW
ncbi:exported hypothetical protein [Candidatus Sulfopaludibacter sp. SbA3]|nr:exported hypothetical protein [Candidatus Sulfopaludibacter sp. SbA3]